MTQELIWFTAVELAQSYSSGKVSPLEATRAVLDRIAAVDGKLNAFCLVDAESALAAARASERRWRNKAPLGPLDGVPATIKDILLTKGWPTLRGSRTVDPNQAWDDDAPVVARLREDGAVILGKTTTPEFGWKGVTDSSLTGITRNPWDISKTPGGSSGGASAALAAGMGALAVGTDGGGSIRIPAGFSGIFGHKPSFGRVPAWPLSPFGTLAHVGPMTRTVADAALMLASISRPDARDWHCLPCEARDYAGELDKPIAGLKLAFSPRLGSVEVDPEVAELVKAAASSFVELGAHVEEVDPQYEDAGPVFRTLWWAGARSLLARLPEEKKRLLDPGLADMVKQAEALSLLDYLDATAARGRIGAAMRLFMQSYDLLLTPTLPIAAFEAGLLAPETDDRGKWVNWAPFSWPFNLTQQPAASVPCGFTRAGLPVGLHIVGRM
ncbi:MAG TPA: amidase, partial [Aestuariivirgaceae bacterium]|nr:amidase [Aestuariivirgaceae bacterium]